MKESDVRARAFAMPLTSPAFPPGPYRFRHREYLIITVFDDRFIDLQRLRHQRAQLIRVGPVL